ncbi:PREDICTED: uncharacterized protein LOC104824143 [Tarenaya hassleriana]|uniref:uncharacterized protein LOC104824143 n=1 Tax=Tarenaya hassleriana TaxID=28532 RepID=UPI00053C8C1F|nr:PREDICTED: uncharacterized protein LOC104824143 [Tarenaya hassleriana]
MASSESRSAAILSIVFFVLLLSVNTIPSSATKRHVINFRLPGLYPEGMAWDPSGEHFVVGSLRRRTIHSVSDAGVVQTLISDPDIPENATILGLAVDSAHGRLLAVVHSAPPLPPFNALAAYDLRARGDSGRRIFLSILPSLPGDDGGSGRDVASDVTVDFRGNAYVTNSAKNFIWKVDRDGVASIFSKSALFTSQPPAPDRDAVVTDRGLNGIVYVSKGYLLVVQSNTGKMFKVNEDDGTARVVILNVDLTAADGIALRRSDGVVVVVSKKKLWYVKSQDSWSEGAVYDESALDGEGMATSVVTAAEGRVYVLYGRVNEGKTGNYEDGSVRIEEVWSEKERGEEHVWLYVLLGLGLAYFCFWRFQMKRLITNLDKKTL